MKFHAEEMTNALIHDELPQFIRTAQKSALSRKNQV